MICTAAFAQAADFLSDFNCNAIPMAQGRVMGRPYWTVMIRDPDATAWRILRAGSRHPRGADYTSQFGSLQQPIFFLGASIHDGVDVT